jgi:hypothetical protein
MPSFGAYKSGETPLLMVYLGVLIYVVGDPALFFALRFLFRIRHKFTADK